MLGQSSRPGLGAMVYADSGGTGVTFRVWAPNASSVGVKGQFNGWATTPLVSEGASGLWSCDYPKARAGQEYKYVINNSFDRRDPRNRRVTHSAGNSVIYNPQAFDWQGQTFTQPWRNDLVLYEMHVGTFNAEAWVPSTFDQAIEKLDHLAALGVNGIQVMPVNEFASDKSWGYNPAEPFAIETSLGGPDAFKRFVMACHARGIAVLVDVVHNHYGPSDLSIWQFDGWSQNGLGGIYFYNDSARASTWWGNTRPDFGRSEVRSFIKDSIGMFLDEYRVDGLRWDSVFNIIYYNDGKNHNGDGESLLREINEDMQSRYPNGYRIAEDNAFDYSMSFESRWDTDFQNHLRWQVTRGSDAERNMSWLGDKIVNGAGLSRVIFAECHDSCGDLNNHVRLPREIDLSNPASVWARKRQLLASSIVLTSPGIPMIFQGQEMNEDWTFSAETALRWSLTNTMKGIVRAYSDLVRLRRNRDGATQGLKGSGVTAHHRDDLNKIIAYIRWDAGGGADDVVVAANFGVQVWTNHSYLIEFPAAGDWYCWFNGDSTNYGADFGNLGPRLGDKVTASGSPARAAVDMGMYSALIFSRTAPQGVGTVSFDPAQPSGCVDVRVNYTPANGPLADATNVVLFVGRNNWKDAVHVRMTNQPGGWGCAQLIPAGTENLDLAFHDGAASNQVWDSNRGLNWSLPVSGCAGVPSSVQVSPSHPAGCVPVTIAYTENNGPLEDAAQVFLYLGRNDWRETQSLAMTSNAAGVWEYALAVLSDTWELNYAFHDNSATQVWDNNSGANWRTEVSGCVTPIEPFVTITNPPSDQSVSSAVSAIQVSGLAAAEIAGSLVWTNFDSGDSGHAGAATHWMLAGLPIAEGVNRIRVTGTNSPANPNQGARDNASNATYTSVLAWTNGQNGGSRWGGGWALTASGSSGFFLAGTNTGNVHIGPYAWGLWANGGGYGEARRRFAAPLHVGDALALRMDNGSIDSDRSAGIAVQNRYGENLFQFFFAGGGTNYILDDDAGNRPTGIPWTDQGLALSMELTAPDAYRFTAAGRMFTGTLAGAQEQAALYFRAWNFSAGSGTDCNFYINDLSITGQPLIVQEYEDDVSVIRAFGPNSDPDGDRYTNWEEEYAGTDPLLSASHPPNALLQAGPRPALSLYLDQTILTRWYALCFSTNLTAGLWRLASPAVAGSGGAITLNATGVLAQACYRVAVATNQNAFE